MTRPKSSWLSLLATPLVKLGHFQLALTYPWPLCYIPGLFYLAWFILLATLPSLIYAGPVLHIGWGIGMLMLGLGLVILCFLRDSERTAALRGLVYSGGDYINVKRIGEEKDPLVAIVDRYPRRLKTGTLLAAACGLTLGFAFLCQGLQGSICSSWFEMPEGVQSLNTSQWVAFAFLNVFRAVDIFNILTIFGIEKFSVSEVVSQVSPSLHSWMESRGWTSQTWANASYLPIHHRGGAASLLIWIFRFTIDLMVLEKLRRSVGAYLLYRQVATRTQSLPSAKEQMLLIPDFGTTLRETGIWLPRYVRKFVRSPRVPIEIRSFAAKAVARIGLESRRFAADFLNVIKCAKDEERQDLLPDLLAAFGRLEVPSEYLGLAKNRKLTLPPPEAGKIWDDNSFNIKFCGIPAGEFEMGTPKEVWEKQQNLPPVTIKELIANERRHRVTLSRAFYLAQTPVTQKQFKEVTGYNPSWFTQSRLEFQNVDVSPIGEHPVENVSWLEAQAFCQILTALEREAGKLPGDWEYRLATDAEWEYACRAGGDVFLHADILSRAWCIENSENRTHPVGEKELGKNAWNLQDMLGNVNEWTWDWYRNEMPESKEIDPDGPLSGSSRVSRGGSWRYGAADCRSASRHRLTPVIRSINYGFRVALSPSRIPK